MDDRPADETNITEIAEVNRELWRAFAGGDGDPVEALRRYLEVKNKLARRFGSFGVVNNRLFAGDGLLVAPYLLGQTLRVYVVSDEQSACVGSLQTVSGQIFTDLQMLRLAAVEAQLEVVDIENRLMVVKGLEESGFKISRMRNITAILARVNEGVNRNEAVFWLRHLVARLCSGTACSLVRAKNIQPEVRLVVAEVVRLTNSPVGRRLPLLMRILVRNLPILIGKPNLIDQLWNDTIALAEVHVRGSAVVNELRRTSHHALGPRTLRIARAYLAFLETGSDWGLRELGFDAPSAADVKAREAEEPKRIVARVIEDVEGLLGQAETAERIRRWKASYVDAQQRCAYGTLIGETVEAGGEGDQGWA